MAILTEVQLARNGTAVTFVAAAAGGDSYANGGTQRVRFKNSSGGALTANIDTPNPDNFGVTADALDIVVNIPAGGDVIAGPFDTPRHNDANGRVQMTYPGGVTGLTVAITSN